MCKNYDRSVKNNTNVQKLKDVRKHSKRSLTFIEVGMFLK